MRKRDVVGRTIVDVEFERWHDRDRGWCHDVRAIVLDNGARLTPHGYETADCPAATIVLNKTQTKKGRS
jgi:hypothetical protein